MRKVSSLLALGLFTVLLTSPVFATTALSSILNRPDLRITDSTSANWAGYAVAATITTTCTGHGPGKTCTGPGPEVTAAYGSWVVQTVSASTSNTYSSEWVGIGGYFDNTLIQTGTESDSVNGVTSYYAWYELLPAGESTISMAVSPGDKMSASVVCTSSCTSSTQTWTITLQDVTSGATPFTTTLSYSSSLLSAEWIEERPALCFAVCTLSTLANFGTADYGMQYTSQSDTNYATVSSSTLAIGSLTNQPITMQSCSGHGPHATCTTLASPGTLTDSGSSFQVAYG